MDGDRAASLGARALDVVDSLGCSDDPLEGSGDISPHQVGICPDIIRRHLDDGDVAPRILTDIQDMDRLEPRKQDDEVHHQRQNGALDKEIGDFHGWMRAGWIPAS